MPTLLRKVERSILPDFAQFLRINRRLERITVLYTVEDVKRFLEKSDYVVSYETISRYLQGYLDKAPKTYNKQITGLRRFVRDFLRLPQLVMSFKMAPIDTFQHYEELPSRVQVRQGFKGLESVMAKTIYLFAATTGLRKGEILGVLKSQVDLESHAVIPNHFTRKKRSGITFYNDEASLWLQKYLGERKDNSEKLFLISDRQWRNIWKDASESAGIKITSKVLRAWFSTELGELAVPDRFVDVFQGRAPRSVLAKHYTGQGLERLKRIYDKAELRILT